MPGTGVFLLALYGYIILVTRYWEFAHILGCIEVPVLKPLQKSSRNFSKKQYLRVSVFNSSFTLYSQQVM